MSGAEKRVLPGANLKLHRRGDERLVAESERESANGFLLETSNAKDGFESIAGADEAEIPARRILENRRGL